jgi:hypothetical protein
MAMRIRSQEIRADAEESALRDAIGKRERLGLPVPPFDEGTITL